MALYPNHCLGHFVFKRIESSIASRELTKWNKDTLVRSHLTVVNCLIAVERCTVEIDGDSRPCELIKVSDRNSRGSQFHVCFQGILCGGRRVFVVSSRNDDDPEKGNDAENGHRSSVVWSLDGCTACWAASCF